MSEENFDEQFLQLDSNINTNVESSPMKEDRGNMNALEQALQDHLNKEKYDPIDNNNFDKYHLRAKNAGNQQISENKTAATNSSGGNTMNFRSRMLVIRKNDQDKAMKSAEGDEEHERQRMELSGILCSSINDFSSQAIGGKNRFKKNQNDGNAAGNTKISNQNALLSLLSQDDFKDLKQQIHGKIADVAGPEGQDSLIIQERNDENEIKGQGGDFDAQSQGVLSQAENNWYLIQQDRTVYKPIINLIWNFTLGNELKFIKSFYNYLIPFLRDQHFSIIYNSVEDRIPLYNNYRLS